MGSKFFKILALLLFWAYLPLAAQGLFTRSEEKFDSTRGIRVSMLPDKKSTYVNWIPNEEGGEVIIARSNSVIDTPEKLYIADSLGRFPSGAKNSVTNYYDYNLKPGSYFYAVIPVDHVRKRKVKLLSNQNYTTDPIIIQEYTDNPAEPMVVAAGKPIAKNESIGTVVVKAEGTNIRVSWVSPWNAVPSQTVYSIYRSSSPMETIEEMRKADKLAELPHPINTYLDKDIEKSQTLYYGVSVKSENLPETIPLENGKSFVRIFFIRDKRGKSEVVQDTEPTELDKSSEKVATTQAEFDTKEFQVKGFGYERVGKGAILKWIAPNQADDTTQYTIYASTRAFDAGVNSFIGGSVLKVAVVPHPSTSISIKEIKPVDELYFAITAKRANVPEDFRVTEGTSYFRYQFDKNKIPEEAIANKEEKTKAPKEVIPTKEESSLSDTPTLGRPQEELEDGSEEFYTIDPEDLEDFIIDEKQLDSERADKLDRILRATYAKGKYELAVSNLEKFIKNETNSKLKGKAYFYAGISRYHRKEYKKALDHFLKVETSEFQSDRTVFWKNRALAKIGRGGR
jgi:hypothetical protein